MKLDVISDNMKYFVFRESVRVSNLDDEIPVNKIPHYPDDDEVHHHALTSASTINTGCSKEKGFSIGMKFYVFELVKNDTVSWIDGKVHYKFV
jgi:hypothetical protein